MITTRPQRAHTNQQVHVTLGDDKSSTHQRQVRRSSGSQQRHTARILPALHFAVIRGRHGEHEPLGAVHGAEVAAARHVQHGLAVVVVTAVIVRASDAQGPDGKHTRRIHTLESESRLPTELNARNF